MHSNTRFFSRILLPSLVAVLLFLVSIYLIVIPNYRESLMAGKQETIRELTNTAWSVMQKLDMMVDDEFNLQEAQSEAALIIGDMRYGEDLKDYFWITDTTPRMIMHPYRPSMIGSDLSDYRDPRGKNFFVDIVNIVKLDGDGYVDYKWQWKDDSLTVVSKLSYVKAYAPWGWIVGTGIYIDDVSREIKNLTRKVVWISMLITLLVGAIITYLARRNYIAEIEREKAQDRMRDSMERYKKLVEESTEGVLMVIENEIVYCNPFLLNLLEYSQEEFDRNDARFFDTLNSLIPERPGGSDKSFDKKELEITSEQEISTKSGRMLNIVVNRSRFEMNGKNGFIFTIKDVSSHKNIERELDLNLDKLQSIAGLMNLGMFRCTVGKASRIIDINAKAMELLGYSSENELEETRVPDLFELNEEKKEVTRALNEGAVIKDRLLKLKRADGTILPVMVSLFPVNDTQGKTIYCDGVFIDAYDHLHRNVSLEENTSLMHLSANILLHPVKDYLLPAPQCEIGTTVSTASKIMSSAKADILLVMNEQSVVGIITHSDISRRVVAVSGNTSVPVSEIMSAPVITVTEDDMIMDAFDLMIRHKISYIVVKSQSPGTHSYISLLSLSELRKDTPEFMINSIRKADTVYEIADVMNQLPGLIAILTETGTGMSTTGKFISKISDSITEKLIEFAIDDLGPPPAPYVFLALGSEGRREQTLATDQDNAIVFIPADPAKDEMCRKYFMKLGSMVCTSLSKVGYPLCKGGVMAMNREYCRGIDEWKNVIMDWVNTPNPQEILNISIFFDFRPVAGDHEIASNLQEFCHKMLKNKEVFFVNLAQSIINLKLITIDISMKNREVYDIKVPILAITSIARLWSLKFGLSERNTPERLFALQSKGVISVKLREEFDRAFRFLMQLRIKNQLQQLENKLEVNNEIHQHKIAEIDKLLIRKITTIISDHQNRLEMEFRAG